MISFDILVDQIYLIVKVKLWKRKCINSLYFYAK